MTTLYCVEYTLLNNAWLVRRYEKTFLYEIRVELILLPMAKFHWIELIVQRHCYFLVHFLYLHCSCPNLIKDIFMLTFHLGSHWFCTHTTIIFSLQEGKKEITQLSTCNSLILFSNLFFLFDIWGMFSQQNAHIHMHTNAHIWDT